MYNGQNEFPDQGGEVGRVFELLLLEDQPAQVRLILDALDTEQIPHQVHVVDTGMDLLDFLHRKGDYAGKPSPSVVMLDIDAPGLGALEVLRVMKADQNLKRIPVIVFGSSDNEHDVRLAYRLKANAYVPKPFGPEDCRQCVQSIVTFWFHIANCPPPFIRRAATV